jgi:DNA-binding Xre family transcriptional regulator
MIKVDVRDRVARKMNVEPDKINIVQLSKEIGLKRPTLYEWLRGEPEAVRLEVLDCWCKWLDCAPGDILVQTHE